MAHWKIGYRFNPRTGTVKPWEVVNTVVDGQGRTVDRVQWGSFKTEASAAKSIPKSISGMEKNPIWAEHTFENVGRIER